MTASTTRSPPAPLRPPQVLLVAAGLLGVAAVVGQVADAGRQIDGPIALTAALAVTYTPLAAFVLARLPQHYIGRLMAATGVTALVALVAMSWSGWVAAAWLSQWAWWPPLSLILLTLLLFPDGRLPSRRWIPVAVVLTGASAVAAVALAAAAALAPRTLLNTVDRVLPERAELLLGVAVYAVVLVLLGLIPVTGSLLLRWRTCREDFVVRSQLRCLALSGMLLVLGLVLEIVGIDYASVATAAALPAGIAMAVLRYRLYDLDLFVNRALVWSTMSALVVVGYAGVVLLAGGLLERQPAVPFVAAALVAVAFEPLRRRVQGAVDRLLYGERNDPYLVLARLGRLLERTVDPLDVLPLIAATVCDALRLPYAAVALDDTGDGPFTVEHGRLVTTPQAFPMVAHGCRVGQLLVAPRRPGDEFTSDERRLLENLALQAAVAAEACRFTLDLQRSRERLVRAREEERRRLRRDLHDGIGPALAGMTLQTGAARALLEVDAGQTQEVLGNLETELRSCMTELRRVVSGLRPPALDELGLAGALRQQVQKFQAAGQGALGISLAVREEDVAGLPAAVEVAAFCIATEATTNVLRHAGASCCRIELCRQGAVLVVEVSDDGAGPGAGSAAGVGSATMRERAAELGGRCTTGPGPGGGTVVRAELPLRGLGLPTREASRGAA